MSVDVITEDDRWQDFGIEALATRAVEATLAHLGLEPLEWEIAVLACDDARIAGLNTDFRGKAKATNVLSWPSRDRAAEMPGARPESPVGDPELGDIAIAFETCVREAAEAGVEPGNHILHLIVHATLHLLGYDHVRDADGDLMEATETAILGKLGVADPYGDKATAGEMDNGKD